MKNFFIFLSTLIITASAASATNWWDQMTVCRINNNKCYDSMGAGFDPEIWDTDAGCRGMKYICADALIQESNEPVLISKKALGNETIINPDYNIEQLSDSGDCFGRRIANKAGNEVKVNGEYVKVWCDGVLDRPDETLANGDILYDEKQLTCGSLKQNRYVAVENGKCFGKYYDENDYHIECGNDDKLQPKRIVILNGAEYKKHNYSGPITVADAEELFDEMLSVSKKQKNKYFKK